MKNRILFSNVIILVILIFSKPVSFEFFYAGLFVILIGQIIRLLASATIVKSKNLTVHGIYSLSRNPLYFGTTLILLGILIQLSSSHFKTTSAIWLFSLVSFYMIYKKTIEAEETFLSSVYKEDFENYLKKVPCLVFDFSRINELFDKKNYNAEAFKKNKEYRGVLGTLAIELVIILKIFYGF